MLSIIQWAIGPNPFPPRHGAFRITVCSQRRVRHLRRRSSLWIRFSATLPVPIFSGSTKTVLQTPWKLNVRFLSNSSLSQYSSWGETPKAGSRFLAVLYNGFCSEGWLCSQTNWKLSKILENPKSWTVAFKVSDLKHDMYHIFFWREGGSLYL